MKIRSSAIILLAILAGVVAPATAAERSGALNALPGPTEPLAGEFDAAPRMIVQFTRLPGDAGARLARVGVTHAAYFPTVNAAAVLGPLRAYRAIAGWQDVVDVSPDARLDTYMWQASANTRVDHVRVGSKPLKSAYTGLGTTVAVMDTGIDSTHPDLDGDKVIAHLDFTPSNIFDPTSDAVQADPTNPSRYDDPVIAEPVESAVGRDDGAHGTLLAGALAGTGETAAGADLRGVAPDAKVVSLDLGGRAMFASSVIAAGEWLLAHGEDPRFPGGIRVVVSGIGANCDADRTCEMPAVRAVLNELIAADMVVVFPAGSAYETAAGVVERQPMTSVTYPARHPEIIAVKGACKDEDNWSGAAPLAAWGIDEPTGSVGGPPRPGSWCGATQAFGHHGGPGVDVVAPGVDIWTTWIRGTGHHPAYRSPAPGAGHPADEAWNRTWYASAWSASLAAAQVAGIATLMIQADPGLDQSKVERILQETARDLADHGFDDVSGYGMVDALRAVRAAERLSRDRS